MKKLLNILTAFLSVIGLCAMTLVGFILIYPYIYDKIPSVHSSSAQLSYSDQNPFASSYTVSYPSPETIIPTGNPIPSAFNSPIPASPDDTISPIPVQTEQTEGEALLSDTFDTSGGISPYYHPSPVVINSDTISPSSVVANSDIVSPLPATEITANTEIPTDNTYISQNDSIQDPQISESNTGRTSSENHFNDYYIPEHHNTTDSYVLNTSTLKIHQPSCRDVEKIAPQNYTTSSLPLTDLYAQGYTTCKHCFRDY